MLQILLPLDFRQRSWLSACLVLQHLGSKHAAMQPEAVVSGLLLHQL
jgi:hypothetical protein